VLAVYVSIGLHGAVFLHACIVECAALPTEHYVTTVKRIAECIRRPVCEGVYAWNF